MKSMTCMTCSYIAHEIYMLARDCCDGNYLKNNKHIASIWRISHSFQPRATFLQTARFSEHTERPRTKTSGRILYLRQMGAMSIKSRQRANAHFLMQKFVQLTLRATLEKGEIFGKTSTRISMDWSCAILFRCCLNLLHSGTSKPAATSLLRHILLGYSPSTEQLDYELEFSIAQ